MGGGMGGVGGDGGIRGGCTHGHMWAAGVAQHTRRRFCAFSWPIFALALDGKCRQGARCWCHLPFLF